MQKDRIFDKAKKLGISIDASLSDEENLEIVASEIGLNNYDVDNLNSLENKLDNEIANNNSSFLSNESSFSDDYDDIQDYNSQNRFGEKEFNAAKDGNGIYNKDYYKNKQEELDKRYEHAKEEKDRDFKKTDDEPVKEDGSNIIGKNKFDKVKDNTEVVRAGIDRARNKVDAAKSKLYAATHPDELIKSKAKEIANNIKENAKEKVKNFVKKEKKEEAKKAVGEALLKNPKVRIAIIIGAGIFILFLILLLSAGNISGNQKICTTECEHFSIKETTLSRREFIDKVQSYFANKNTTYASEFSNHAGEIYDISKNVNVNPEMVLIRAVEEGFSPGKSKNNYWGMGCTNTGGYDACIDYSSFEEGVKGFVNNISQYDTVTNMMLKYSYIGRYWYNPGNSGLGGCYYFPHIREYMSEQRAREVEKICNSGIICTREDTSNCVETTEEDQKAKATRSVLKMEYIRKEIFGLDPGLCAEVCKGDSNVNQDGIIFRQGDSRWGSIPLGNSSTTMARSGCAVTSIAIGISFSKTNVTVSNFDAGVFINALNAGNCFTNSGAIKWNCSAISGIAPNVHLISRQSLGGSNNNKISEINQYPIDSYILLVHFSNRNHVRGHYVNFQEFTNLNEYLARDPGSGTITTEQISEIDQLIVYSY